MRLLIAFLLSLCLSLNAAYAAGSDVCDALEGAAHEGMRVVASLHGEHFGHHAHDHDHVQVPAPNDQSSPADPAVQTAHADHCHPHQCFTSAVPGELAWSPLAGTAPLSIGPSDQLVSISPSRLERPPRAALA